MTPSEEKLGWLYFAFQLLFLPTLLALLNRSYLHLPDAWLNLAFYTVNFGCVFLIFRRFLLSSVTYGAKRKAWLLRAVLLGLAGDITISNLWNGLIASFFPGFSNVNDASIQIMLRQDFLPVAVGTVLLVPLAEETMFRGLIFRGIYNKSKVTAYIVSIAAFCAVHIVGYIGIYDPVTLALCFVQYIPAGVCLAWAYAEADTILAPILIHTFVNAMSIYLVMR